MITSLKAVLATLKKVLGIAGEVALDVVVTSAYALEHVPVPWLQKIAVMFISIWKAVQKVSVCIFIQAVLKYRFNDVYLSDEQDCISPPCTNLYQYPGFYL